ncbi:MAG: Tat pathway signal sequence [Coriobacteriia bacterium]|nr:Tat pathway signal sequence [Coriobacteriia bacterium]
MAKNKLDLDTFFNAMGMQLNPQMKRPTQEEKDAEGETPEGEWSPAVEEQIRKQRALTKRLKRWFFILILPIIVIAYWWFHPALNIHSVDIWYFFGILVLLPSFLLLRSRSKAYQEGNEKFEVDAKKSDRFNKLAFIPIFVVIIGLIGALGSATFYPGNAKRYASVLVTDKSTFAEDIQQVNYSEIPIIDRDSAALLGNRTMGAIPEYVSQFVISDLYCQINYQNRPVRVSPLNYADIIKWFNNRTEGLPAFVLIDMTTQDANIVRLEKPMKYSQSEPLFRNVDRHVQLSYPFYLFDQFSFEIDDDGNPWWVCPVQKRTIGLFGGTTIHRVVLCDANTGECTDYALEDCPIWVDRVFPADLIIQQYNWSGAYQRGWINSWLGQEGVVQTTSGYNYIAKDDDVWLYTGVTSKVSDNSIVGFVLVNQRTAESHYYAIAGAMEESAMRSAQGQVQHLGYQATFPLLININSQPTYFMALKDAAGLVKMYAMLDIQRYQNVAVGDTLQECQRNYLELLRTNGVILPEASRPDLIEASGTVTRIAMAVIDGNSHFYLVLEGDANFYDCALPEVLDVLMLEEGDSVTLSYREADGIRKVESMTIRPAPKPPSG